MFTFRPMRRDDLPRLIVWQQSPAARRWFPQLTLDEALERFGPRLDDPSGVRMLVVHHEGHDIGFADVFRVRDLPPGGVIPADVDDVGIDFCIGEPELVGRGLGTQLIAQLAELAIWVFPEATGIVACPNHRNHASIRVLERNGFVAGLWFDAPRSDGRMETLVAHRRPR